MRALRLALLLLLSLDVACGDSPGAADDAGPDLEPACARDDCLCTSEADCLSHSECIFTEGATSSECTCVTGYAKVGEFCIFSGLEDPDFDGEPAAWTAQSPAVIDGAASGLGMVDDGEAVWTNDAVNALVTVRQSLTMPTLEKSEPFVAVVNQRFDASYNVGIWEALAPHATVRLGQQRTRVPLEGGGGVWQSSRICLGESAYGGDVDFGIEPSHQTVKGALDGEYTFRVDRMQIEPAVQGECPAPGEVMNGDFESQMGWTGSADTATSSANIENDGVGGSRAGVLLAKGGGMGSCSARPWLRTKVSVPNSDSGLALQFYWKTKSGLDDDNEEPWVAVDVGLGIGEHANALLFYQWVRPDRPIGSLGGQDSNPAISTMCIPPHMKGSVADLTFRMLYGGAHCDEPRSLTVDDIQIIETAGCPAVGEGADTSFEAPENAVLSGWTHYQDEGVEISSVSVPDALDGKRVMRMRSYPRASCWELDIGTSLRYPDPVSGELPAIRFSYRFSPSTTSGARIWWARNKDQAANGGIRARRILAVDDMGVLIPGWRTATVCDAEGEAGRPVEFMVEYGPLDCTVDQYVDIDQVQAITVPASECTN